MYFQEIDKIYRDFISDNSRREMVIFCPYIKTESLKKILADKPRKLSIVTSWRTHDILQGVSELELYLFCKENGFFLYVNQRIHLKLITDYYGAIFGSANITARALGLTSTPNYECVGIQQTLQSDEQIYLRSILQESYLMNDDEFKKVKKEIEQYQKNFKGFEEYPDIDFTNGVDKEFLISALPMSISVDTFFDYYSEKLVSHGFADVDYNCAMHDLALCKIQSGLDRKAFNQVLKASFFSQPFIQELKKFIYKERYFGEIKDWVQKTCLDVPIPSKRDLTGNVQVLYEWFSELGKDEYIVDRPNHSERIHPKNKIKKPLYTPDKSAGNTPALFVPVERHWINEAFDYFNKGKEKVYFTTSSGIGAAAQLSIEHVYFKLKGDKTVSAIADFIDLTTDNPVDFRLRGSEGQTGKYYYGYKNLKWLKNPIDLLELKYFESQKNLRIDVPGACIILDPGLGNYIA